MEFDQLAFKNYLSELKIHLFEEMSIGNIIAEVNNNHQARRFMTMYVLQDKATFDSYRKKRKDFGINQIVDTAISALFHETDKKPAKKELIDLLHISVGMRYKKIEGYAIMEFDKDLNSFLFYWRKRSGKLMEMIDKLKQQNLEV